MFGEVELDLAQHGLITDIDHALDNRTWHYVRSAITRLLSADAPSWTKKEVMAGVRLRSGRDRIPTEDGRGGSIQTSR